MNQELIDLYLMDRKKALAESTLKSRRSRLKALLISMDPDKLHTALEAKGTKPYTIKTTFIEIGNFYGWLMKKGHVQVGPNPFREFMKEHTRLFKNAYEPERIEFDFEEAKKRIDQIGRREIREKARQLLFSGMRWTESFTLKSGAVKGKGGKYAPVFCPEGLQDIELSVGYHTFRRELAKVGLKPHTLRKMVATKLAREGASAADIKRYMRWSSINTANSYIQAVTDDKLQAWSEGIFNGVEVSKAV